MHYNVQSLVPKLDLLTTELNEFDILAFTETWLNPSVPTNDLTIDSYKIPEHKDRPGDSHGGVILYVKNNIHYTRRHDLELRGVESIWIELINPDIRNAGTLDAFKHKLNQNLPVIPKHYYSGIRKYQIWHTRIRTGCSSLKNDLFLKNIIDSPLCTCNSEEIENAYHIFFYLSTIQSS